MITRWPLPEHDFQRSFLAEAARPLSRWLLRVLDQDAPARVRRPAADARHPRGETFFPAEHHAFL